MLHSNAGAFKDNCDPGAEQSRADGDSPTGPTSGLRGITTSLPAGEAAGQRRILVKACRGLHGDLLKAFMAELCTLPVQML
jgi:hypothetical protein